MLGLVYIFYRNQYLNQKSFFLIFITFSNLGAAWIGFTDAATEGTFEWTLPYKGGTSKKFTNWKTEEPNDYNSDEDCATLSSSGFWNDNPCQHDKPFVCEFGKK